MTNAIPEDIMQAASKAIEGWGGPHGRLAISVANAILAERLRCAAKAEKWARDVQNSSTARITAGKIVVEINQID